MVAVGVCDENLAESVTAYQLHNLLHPLCIEFVEDVVEQQQGRRAAARSAEEVELRQFQGDEEGLALPLRALATYRIAVLQHLEIVFVDAVQGISDGSVLEALAGELLQEGTSLKVGHIAELHLFLLLRNAVVELLEDGDEFGNVRVAFLIDVRTLASHLLLEEQHHLWVGLLFLLQQGVALLQGFVVADE